MSAKYPSVNNKFIYLSFFPVKMVFRENRSSSSSSQVNHKRAFPQDNHHTSICSRSALQVLVFSLHRILKWYIFKGHGLIKFNHFYCFTKGIFQKTSIILTAKCVAVKNIMTISNRCATVLIHIKCQQFTHHCFCTTSTNANIVKKANVLESLWK